MELTPLQNAALEKFKAWRADPNAKQIFNLQGAAGSGKTECAKVFAKHVDGTVLFGAFTGRAAHVLRQKGCFAAQTIHSQIYKPAGDPPTEKSLDKIRAELKKLQETPGTDPALLQSVADYLKREEEAAKRASPRFKLNKDSPVATAKLFVADEAGMIDKRLGADLTSFGTPILTLGDPAQLPPIYGQSYFMQDDPDVLFDEIHRQALDSPILYLADLARRDKDLPIGRHGTCDVIRIHDPRLRDFVLEADVILVGRNVTRRSWNARIRELRGFTTPHPSPGERVICLRNDHERGLFNGSTWIVEACEPNFEAMTCRLSMTSTDDGTQIDCDAWLHHFMGRDEELSPFLKMERREIQRLTWGSVITTHRAQGGGWNNVLVFDESKAFGPTAKNWKYTAATRAIKRLVWCSNG